jgi:predicted nuclease with RNAse H fold
LAELLLVAVVVVLQMEQVALKETIRHLVLCFMDMLEAAVRAVKIQRVLVQQGVGVAAVLLLAHQQHQALAVWVALHL